MKNLFFALFSMIVLVSCEGDRGPVGPQGPYIVGTVFEIGNVNLNQGNEYSFLGDFYDYLPADVEVYPSDVVLIYLNEGLANNGDDIWSLMPQTFYLAGGGIVQYNYNHTLQDFEIYLQGNGDLNSLPSSYTQNQIFRIAVLPADYATSGKIDLSNYESVVSGLQSQDPNFEVIQFEK